MTSPDQLLPLTETVEPDDQAAVAQLMRDAHRAGTPVYPIGGRTNLGLGMKPTLPGIGLSTSKLNRLVDHPARDLTITAEAGVTIARLSKQLAAENQRLPVDVPLADRATLGGVVAGNPSGPRRFGWGTMRDYVIGVRAVDGFGMPFAGGGRVVKNAAGYNLCRLLTGSLGTLGIITQVTLMVKPMPEGSALLACDVADYDTAERLLDGLTHTQTLPTAIELLAGPAWKNDDALASPSGVARLVVGFEGTEAEVDWMVETLTGEWHRAGVQTPLLVPDTKAGPVWDRLTELPIESPDSDIPVNDISAPLIVEISVLPSKTVCLIERLRKLDPGCSIQAHAGDGIIRARFSFAPRFVAEVISDRLRPVVSAAGGRMIVLAYPREVSLDCPSVWGPPGEGATVMQAIKDRFDPKGLLNPGRFVYG